MHSSTGTSGRRFATVAYLLLLGCLSVARARGQVANTPRLGAFFPAGAQAGADCEITITGEGIEGDQQLVFSNASIVASPVMTPPSKFYPNPRPLANHFKVKIGSDVNAGTYSVRVVTPLGVSNSRSFLVGTLPEVIQARSNRELEAAAPIDGPCVVNGVLAPQGTDYYRFRAAHGQKWVIHCDSRSMDSRAEPILALYRADGSLVREIHDPVRIEPTLSFLAPADEDYVVAIHDFIYAGGPEYGYRLSITRGPWIDFVDPPFVDAEGGKHILYGRNLPGSTTASEMSLNGEPLERLEVEIKPPRGQSPALETFLQPGDASIDSFSYRFAGPSGVSNPVRLARVSGPMGTEAEPNDTPRQAQRLTVPAQVVGHFNPRGDRDWYQFHASKGQKLWIEVISQRLGLPTDPQLTIEQVSKDPSTENGMKLIADVDDGPKMDDGQPRARIVNLDPAYAFTAPEEADYRILVQDLYSGAQGAPWLQYLLIVRPARPDYQLLVYPIRVSANDQNTPQGNVARKGTGAVIDVVALRREGFNGPIELSAEPAPPGVTVRRGYIAAGANGGALMLQAAPDAADWCGPLHVIGKACGADPQGGAEEAKDQPWQAVHWALPVETLFVNNNGGTIQPTRVAFDYNIAVRGGLALPFTIDAGDKTWRVPRGGKAVIPTRLIRNPDFLDDKYSGEVRLNASAQGQVRPEGVTFDGSTNQKDLVINVDAAAAVGPYSFVLKGEAPATLTREAALSGADDDLKRIKTISKGVAEAAQQHDRCEQAAAQATTLLAQAKDQRMAKQQAAEETKRKAKESARHAAQLEQAASNAGAVSAAAPTGGDAALKPSPEVVAAQKQARTDAEKATAAEAALAGADRAQALAQEQLKAAEEAKRAAAKTDADLKEQSKAAEEALRAAEELARKAAELSKPREMRVQVASAPILLDVVAAPFALKATPPPSEIQPGGKPVECQVALASDDGFSDEVKFELAPPAGVSGISLGDKQSTLERGKTQMNLAIRVERGVPAGDHACILRAHYKYNNRDLSLDLPFPVRVSAAPPGAK